LKNIGTLGEIQKTMGTKKELIETHKLLSEGKLKSQIGKTFPFTEIKTAHSFLENSKDTGHVGKIVLKW